MTRFLRRFGIAIGLTVLALAADSRADSPISIDYTGDETLGTEAFGINDRGDIVGRWFDFDENIHGFLLRNGRFTPLDVPGAITTGALDINNFGVVVGRTVDAEGVSHGFVWKDGRFKLFDYPGAVQTMARGIDDFGRITGTYVMEGESDQHGYLLDHGGFHPINKPDATLTHPFDINILGRMVGNWRGADGVVSGFTMFRGASEREHSGRAIRHGPRHQRPGRPRRLLRGE